MYREGGTLPDPVCDPGSLNPAVTQATIHTTICVVGYTATIRPPQSTTGPQKRASMARYGVTNPALYEYDHLISLEVGGSADDPAANLWPEPHTAVGPDGQPSGSFVKDGYVNYHHRQICAGVVTLAAAQRAIAGDWYAGFVAAGRPKG